MSKKSYLIAAVASLVVVVALLILPSIQIDSANSTWTPSRSDFIKSTLTKHFTDKSVAYSVDAITLTTDLGESYVYVRASVLDQTASISTLDFVLLQKSATFFQVILGVGNDFTETEIREKNISTVITGKILRLRATSLTGESE